MVGQAVLILSTAIVLFVIGFVTVSLPLCVRMRPKLFEDYAVPISVVMDFAGGMFVSQCFLVFLFLLVLVGNIFSSSLSSSSLSSALSSNFSCRFKK